MYSLGIKKQYGGLRQNLVISPRHVHKQWIGPIYRIGATKLMGVSLKSA
jgi:hypothetical protein